MTIFSNIFTDICIVVASTPTPANTCRHNGKCLARFENNAKCQKMTTILQINRQDLRAELQSIVAEIRSDERKQIEKDEDRLLDTDAVKSMASISETTLWRWQKAGYLTPIYIGGVRRYRLSEVKSLMSGGC